MRFLLTFLMDPAALPDADLNSKCFREMMSFVDELKSSGILLFDSQVLPEPPVTRLVSVNGRTTETRPTAGFVLGGFFIIETASYAEALELARRCPHSQVGPVEIRPLNESSENAFP